MEEINMYCKKCGVELDNGAKFCIGCGNEVSTDTNIVKEELPDDNQIRFELKPQFKWLYKILTEGIGSVVVYSFVIWYIFSDSLRLIDSINDSGFSFLIPALVILIPLVKLMFESMQYKKLCYNFYNNKLEYIDGFLNKTEKELKYKHIREIVMSEGIMERIFGIGTIKIFTNASSNVQSQSSFGHMTGNGNGIVIHCLTDVKAKYQEIKKIVDEGTVE